MHAHIECMRLVYGYPRTTQRPEGCGGGGGGVDPLEGGGAFCRPSATGLRLAVDGDGCAMHSYHNYIADGSRTIQTLGQHWGIVRSKDYLQHGYFTQ